MSRSDRTTRTVAEMFRAALFWAILGAMLSFSVAELNPVYFVGFVGAMLVAWFASVRPARPAPRKVINTILLLVITIAGVETLRSGVGVSAFAVFVALLLVVKLLDLRGPKDEGQVLVLCLSILVAAVLTSNSFLTGSMMLIESVLLLRAFVLFQMYTVVKLGRSPSSRVNRRAKIDIRSMMLGAGFLCVLIAGVLFVVLPRNVGSQAFGQWGAARSVSGFTDEVELGRPGRITMSSTPVFDMTVRNRDGMNVGEENGQPIYLRGAVLEEYQSGNWSRSSVMRVPLAERPQFFTANTTLKPRDRGDYSRWDHQYEIALRSVSDGPVYLFTPWRPVEFDTMNQPMRLGYDFKRGLFMKDGVGRSTLQYAVRTVNDSFRPTEMLDGAERRFVDLVVINERVAQRAYEIVRDGGVEPDPNLRPIQMDAAAVRLLETHLRTQYKYTLDALPVPPGRDATEWFLFDRRQGHCEYYASALTLMCRSIGVQARVVTGYIASDFNSVTGQYIVRESNAHAWVEAEIAPDHWRTFDGTPPGDFHDLHVPDPSLMRSIAKLYESVEFLWGRVVVGYDSDARDQIVGSNMGDFGLAHLSDRLLARFAAGRAKLITRAAVVAVIVFSASMFLGILLTRTESVSKLVREVLALIFARFGLSSFARTEHEEPVDMLEHAVESALESNQIPRPSWQPLRQHLLNHQEFIAQRSDLSKALWESADLIYQSRFSRSPSVATTHLNELVQILRTSENVAQATCAASEERI